MKTITFTEFRRRASGLLDLVEKGETVHVTRHGKAIARISPIDAPGGTPSWKSPGLRLAATGASLAQAVLAERRASK